MRTPALLACVAFACGSPQVGSLGPTARRVLEAPGFSWRIVSLNDRGIQLFLQKGSAADTDAAIVADSVKRAQADVLAMLGEPLRPARSGGDRTIDTLQNAALFFVGSRGDMRRLAGRPLAGFVQPGEPTAVFVWARGYRAPLRHELAHLYTFARWGRPAAGDTSAWLVEGIGGWVGGPCIGHSADALAAGLLARNELPRTEDLRTRFRTLPEERAMPAAASLTEFLHQREGVAGLRRRWAERSSEAIPDLSTDAAWRAHLHSVRAESLEVERVVREGC